MPYFAIMTGLRGCYMPDQCYTIKAPTRRLLRQTIAEEATSARDAGMFGLSNKAVAAFAAECWRRRDDKRWTLDLVLPYGAKPGERPYGIMVSRSTKLDYDNEGKE